MVNIRLFAYLTIRNKNGKKKFDCSIDNKCRYKGNEKCYAGREIKSAIDAALPSCKASVKSEIFMKFNSRHHTYRTEVSDYSMLT